MFAVSFESLLLTVCPAVVGLLALAGGSWLISARQNQRGKTNPLMVVGGALLLIVALGIGGCYAMVFIG